MNILFVVAISFSGQQKTTHKASNLSVPNIIISPRVFSVFFVFTSAPERVSSVFFVYDSAPAAVALVFRLTADQPGSQGSKKQRNHPMYPKVKVREYKDEDDKHDVAVGLKIFESLSICVSSSPVQKHQDVAPPFVARIQKCNVPNAVTPTISTCQGTEKNDKKVNEKDRPNIRTTSTLRPRAVLSSPDNDAVIGNRNKIGADRPRVLRNHNLIQNRHANAHGKVIPGTKCQTNTKLSDDTADNKSDHKGKKSSVMAVPTQRRYLRSVKSGSAKS